MHKKEKRKVEFIIPFQLKKQKVRNLAVTFPPLSLLNRINQALLKVFVLGISKPPDHQISLELMISRSYARFFA